MQMEKEKQNYDFENLQSQLDKSHGQITRMQKERETIQLEIDRLQDKHEKAQVLIKLFSEIVYLYSFEKKVLFSQLPKMKTIKMSSIMN